MADGILGGVMFSRILRQSSIVALLLASAPALAASDTSPNPVRSRSNRRSGLAVIVGIETYRGALLPAKHARRDAEVFAAFAETTLGIPASRIRLLRDDHATAADLDEALRWAKATAEPESSIWFYFSGHGTPSLETGESLLVPYDVDATNVGRRGVSVTGIVRALEALPGKERFVVLDACFSGAGARSVLPEGKRPLMPVVALPRTAGNAVLFAATDAKGTSGPSRKAPHGLFSYHLFNALRGSADRDADGVVTVAEVATYVRQRVSLEAKESGDSQLPEAQVGELGLVAMVEEPGDDVPLPPTPVVVAPAVVAMPAAALAPVPPPVVAPPVVAPPPAPAAVPTGFLHVSSEPPGLPIFVDGSEADAKAAGFLELPAGPHRIEVRVATFAAGRDVVIGAFQKLELSIPLPQARLGRLRIVTEPAGAALLLDGKEVGTSPLFVEGVAVGERVVEARLGDAEGTRTVEVKAGELVEASLGLNDSRWEFSGLAVLASGFGGTGISGGPAVRLKWREARYGQLEVGGGALPPGTDAGRLGGGAGMGAHVTQLLRVPLKANSLGLLLLPRELINIDVGAGLFFRSGGTVGPLVEAQLELFWLSLGALVTPFEGGYTASAGPRFAW